MSDWGMGEHEPDRLPETDAEAFARLTEGRSEWDATLKGLFSGLIAQGGIYQNLCFQVGGVPITVLIGVDDAATLLNQADAQIRDYLSEEMECNPLETGGYLEIEIDD